MNYLFNLAEYSLDHNYWLPQFNDEQMSHFLNMKNNDPKLSNAGGGGPGSGYDTTSSYIGDLIRCVPSGTGSGAPSGTLSLEAITATLNTHFSHLKPIVFAPCLAASSRLDSDTGPPHLPWHAKAAAGHHQSLPLRGALPARGCLLALSNKRFVGLATLVSFFSLTAHISIQLIYLVCSQARSLRSLKPSRARTCHSS